MRGLVPFAAGVAAAVALWVSAAGAAQNVKAGPLAQGIAVSKQHIPLSRAGSTKPHALPGVPAKGNYAFLLKLAVKSTGHAYYANLPAGRSAARAAATQQLTAVRAAQGRVIAALPSGSHVLYHTHAALAGVAVYTNVANATALQRISGVAAVYPIAPKKPSLTYAVPLVHAPQAWETYGDTGAGTTIADIDTGIDYTHSDFGGVGTVAEYTDSKAQLGEPVSPGEFPGPKVAGGFDLVGDDYNADPTDPNFNPVTSPDPWPLDCNGHGSHTAGIAAGYGENADGSTYTGNYDTSTPFSTMKIGPGMAPEAQIYAYRVFGCEGSTDVVGDAIDMASDPDGNGNPSDHVDVITMSLGSDFGSPQDGDSVLSNAASELGISVVAAAGNAGDVYDTGGSPGNAQRVIGVAASVDAQSVIDSLHVSFDGTAQDPMGAERSVAYDWANDPDLSGEVVPLTQQTNLDGCDTLNTADAAAVNGKVAFLEWTDDDTARRCGSAARSAKVLAAGAIGAVFADDQEAFAAGITGSAVIPVVMVTKSAGDAIRTALATKTVTVDGTSANDFQLSIPADDDKVAGFTSRGIREAGNLKPDVSAVGASVFSAGNDTGNDGVSESGTSMATPMVAGLAALVHNENSGWTPEEIKADIMNTAEQDLFTDDNHGGTTYAPNRVGAGRIDAKAALDSQVLAYVTDDPGEVSASFGPIAATGPMTLHKTIKLDNKSGTAETYDVTYDALTTVPGAAYSVSPSSAMLPAHASTTVTLTLTIDPTQLTKTIDPTVDPFGGGLPREFVADASGRVLFTPQDASPMLRVPVYSAPRPASAMTQPSALDMPDGAIQSASLPLSGTGVDQGSGPDGTLVQSLVAGFELQAQSGALTGIPSDEKAADLKYVGTTSDAPQLASIGDDALNDGEEYFAISTQGPWHTAASQNEYDIYIDADGDGIPDIVTFNTRFDGTDILIDETIDLNTGDVLDVELINDRFGDTDTALFDSDTLVMPVFIPDALPGLSAGNSRITYGVVTFGSFSGDPVDSVGFDSSFDLDGSLSTDVLNPGVAVFGAFDGNESPLLWQDMPGTSLTVRRDSAAYAADNGQGALLVHFHNAVGSKAQVVDIGHTLTVTKSGSGSGTVTSSPAGVACGAGCVGSFATGSSVTLTANAAGWSGGGCSGTGTCHVTMNADKAVTATFTLQHTLSVTKAGSGTGSVTSSPAGINCGSTCAAAFDTGASVTLTATADSGSDFTGWSGGGCSGTDTCQVTLNADTTVTATFTKQAVTDNTPPNVKGLKVKVNHKKHTAKVTFKGTDPGHSSKGLRFKCKLDKKRFKSCRSPKLYKHLRHGKHTVQVKAIDKAGNVSRPAKRKFKV
jgi:subtilisin family serine protease